MREADLYASIGAELRSSGYETLQTKFGIRSHEHGLRRTIDVFAYRWQGDSIDAAAVECKRDPPPRGILNAIVQAVEYAQVVGKAYVAALDDRCLEGKEILDKLGIGYIAATKQVSRIVSRPDASGSWIADMTKYHDQVVARARLLLSFRDYVARFDRAKIKCGALDERRVWIALQVRGGIQHNASLDPRIGGPLRASFFSGVNVEEKAEAKRLFGSANKGRSRDLSSLLNSLPEGYVLRLRERTRRGLEDQPNDLKRFACGSIRPSDLDSYTQGVRKILRSVDPRTTGIRPQVIVHRPIWGLADDVRRADAVNLMSKVRDEISPVVSYLTNLESHS